MAVAKTTKEVMGLRVSRGGKFLRELDLADKLTIGGAPTDHIVKAGEKKSAVLFRRTPNGEAELLLAENYRGEIGAEGEMLSFGHLKALGLLKREGSTYVLPIPHGRSGHVEADGLTFEFGYRPAIGSQVVAIPKTGPGYEAVGRMIDPDNMRYYRTLVLTSALAIAFMIFVPYAHVQERMMKVEDLVRRVTKLEVPEATTGVGVTETTTDVGAGGGGGGGGGGPAGAGIPTTGVIAAITTLGPGSGRSIADILGAGGSSGDLDGIVSGLGGLKGAGGGGALGGGLGAGGPGGTGIGGGVDGIAGLAGGFGAGGPGGKLLKKKVSVSGTVSSVGGAGANEKNRSADAIGSVIRRHLSGIQNAYNTALKQNPNLGGGKIVVRFTISASGDVTSASVVSDSMGAASLTSSILSRIRSWKFPTIASGDVTVVYPFVFVATE